LQPAEGKSLSRRSASDCLASAASKPSCSSQRRTVTSRGAKISQHVTTAASAAGRPDIQLLLLGRLIVVGDSTTVLEMTAKNSISATTTAPTLRLWDPCQFKELSQNSRDAPCCKTIQKRFNPQTA
jgi:hypothetical protein